MLDGGQGDDVLNGGAGDDWLFGDSAPSGFGSGSASAFSMSGLAAAAASGSASGGHNSGSHNSGSASGDPVSFNDYLDGGAGNDHLFAQQGDDIANYTMVENLGPGFADIGTQDNYDGGFGTDTLRLTLTHGEYALASMQQDIADYQAFLAAHSNPNTDNGPTFDFTTFDLSATDFEALEIELTNVAPTANADTAGGHENETLTIDVLANDTDPDHLDVLTLDSVSIASVTGLSGPAGGTVSIVGNQLQFDPGTDFDELDEGDTATVTVDYTIVDLAGAPSTSTATITVTGTNDAPVAVADIAGGHENQTLTVDVLANDTDVDGDDNPSNFTLDSVSILSVTGLSGPAGGTVSIVGNQLQFAPGSDFDELDVGDTATVTVDYTMSDDSGAPSSSTATITVTGTNDAPVAVADVAGGHENQTLTIDVLANDTDVDGDDNPSNFTLDTVSIASVTGLSGPTGGTVSIVGNQLQFAPGSDFDELDVGDTATVTVDYTLSDDSGAPSSSTATITVTGTNDAPVATDDSLSGASGGSGTLAEVEGNDNIATAQSLDGHFALVTDPNVANSATQPHVSVLGTGNNTADYYSFTVPEAGTTMHFDIDFGMPDFDPYIHLWNSDGVRIARNDDSSTDPGSTHSYDSEMSYTFSAPGTYYISVGQFPGYTNPDNPVPNGADYTLQVSTTADVGSLTDEDTAVTIATADLLANDTDVDNDAVLSVSAVSAVSALGVGVSLSGTDITYDPSGTLDHLAEGETVTDSFTYTVTDEHGATDTATVTFDVTGANDAPVIGSFTVPTGASVNSVNGNAYQFVSGSHSWGDANAAAQAAGGHLATITDAQENAFVYGLTAGAWAWLGGSDAAAEGTWQWQDGPEAGTTFWNGGTSGSSPTYANWQPGSEPNNLNNEDYVHMWGSGYWNDIPSWYGMGYVVEYEGGSPLSGDVIEDSVLSASGTLSAADVDNGAVLTWSVDNGAGAYGNMSIGPSGEWTYTLNNGAANVQALGGDDTVTETFTVRVTDEHGASDTETVTISVDGVNDAPVALNDTASTNEDTAMAIDVLANDTDVDGDLMTASVGGTSVFGASLSVNADGTIQYDPSGSSTLQALNSGQSMTDSFVYTVSDGNGGVDTATVSVTVAGASDGPSAVNDTVSTDEDTTTFINVLANDTATVGGKTIIGINGGGTSGETSAQGAGLQVQFGQIVYDPLQSTALQALNGGDSAVDTFTYTMQDGSGNVSTATVTVNVAGLTDTGPIDSGVNTVMGFDNLTGTPGSYTEDNMTVTSLYQGSAHIHDSGDDIRNHSGCCSTPYEFRYFNPANNDTSFSLNSIVNVSGTGEWTSSKGGSVNVTTTGTITFGTDFDDVEWVRWHEASGSNYIDDFAFTA